MKRVIKCILTLFLLSLPLKGNRTSAIRNFSEAKATEIKLMADKYYDSDKYPLALTYYIKGMETAENEKDLHTYMACIGNIANIYEAIGDYESNLHYLLKGYRMSAEINDKELKYNYLTNTVTAYCRLGNVRKAKEYFEKLKQEYGDKLTKKQKYFMIYNAASILKAEGKYSRAAAKHAEALTFAESNGMDSIYMLYQKSEIGGICIKLGQYNKAITCGYACTEMSRKIKSMDLLTNAYGILRDAYKETGQKDSAQKYRRLYLELSDSVFNARGIYTAKGRLKEYESRKNNEQISTLTSRIDRQTLVITLVSALFTISVTLIILLVRKNNSLHNMQKLLISRNNELMMSDESSRILIEPHSDRPPPSTCQEGNSDKNAEQELTAEQEAGLLGKIISITNDISVISDPDFSLKTLAEMANSNTSYVSLVINKTYNKNFRTFINEKRIREACKRLSDTDNYGNMTIQAIYEEVGYTNAVSFIRAFKKVNGMTPAKYKKLSCEKK